MKVRDQLNSRFHRGGRLFMAVLVMSWSLFRSAAQNVQENGLDTLVSGDTAFAFRLLHQLIHEQPDANVFISPYSIATVLHVL